MGQAAALHTVLACATNIATGTTLGMRDTMHGMLSILRGSWQGKAGCSHWL